MRKNREDGGEGNDASGRLAATTASSTSAQLSPLLSLCNSTSTRQRCIHSVIDFFSSYLVSITTLVLPVDTQLTGVPATPISRAPISSWSYPRSYIYTLSTP